MARSRSAVLNEVTRRVVERSRPGREPYLARVGEARARGARRVGLSCANLAHGMAACPSVDKQRLREGSPPAIAIVTAYNDLLSAHQPYVAYPALLKDAVRQVGGVAMVAGGVPAMCDGITQGQPGMELSLLSREVIALSTAVALSHGMFDGALLLGVCDKIVPGLLMGALSFGHLPAIFVPSGPMASGASNAEKAQVRTRFAQGLATREELLEVEARAYHGPGTCTFYGTANTNQLLMEGLGLHLPGATFEGPGSVLRDSFTREAGRRITAMAADPAHPPLGEMLTERSFVNAVVLLLATGGSTNHTLHLPAMASAAGIDLRWEDMAALSEVVPLLTRVYPNGTADVNHLHAAGGVAFLIGELLGAGLLHEDVWTVAGQGLRAYHSTPRWTPSGLTWAPGPERSLDEEVLRPIQRPFDPAGGLRVLEGGLGRAVLKVSAVAPEHRRVVAPARVFDDADAVVAAFERGELARDVVVVVRFQGPRACGMPELHQLTPCLTALQQQGHAVALVTDGRMSGASGKVPAAIHLTPEAALGGPIARLRDGDVVEVDADAAVLRCHLAPGELAARPPATPSLERHNAGVGRELFTFMRGALGPADQGAGLWGRGDGSDLTRHTSAA